MTRHLPRAGFLRLAVSLLLLTTAYGCRSQAEREVSETIESLVSAARERQVDVLIDHLSEDFCGRMGPRLPPIAAGDGCQGLGKEPTAKMLRRALEKAGWQGIFVVERDIGLEAEVAKVKLTLLLARGNAVEKLEDVLPTNAETRRFDLTLVRKASRWVVTEGYSRRLQLPEP